MDRGFLRLLLRGAVVVPLDEQSAPDFVDRARRQVEARFLLLGEEQARHFKDLRPVARFDHLAALVERHSAAPYRGERIGADDLAEIIFTSGTTAEPKGVCLTHRNLTGKHCAARN